MDAKRVEGVNCRECRIKIFGVAFTISILGLVTGVLNSIDLWLNNEVRDSYMPKYTYPILGAASISYLGMVIRCMFKDAPVPTYLLEKDGREYLLFAVMIVMYCITYFVPTSLRFELSNLAMIFIEAVILMVQLNWPAQDFTAHDMLITIITGIWFAFLGIAGADEHWAVFIVTLLYFPLWYKIISFFDDPSGLEHQYHRI